MNKKKIIENTGWMIGEKTISFLVVLVVSPLCAKFLGPSQYGLIEYSRSIVSVFAIISTLGINSVLVKEIISSQENVGVYLGTSLRMRLLAAVIFWISAVVVAWILDEGTLVLVKVTVILGMSMVFQVYEVFMCWFQGMMQMKYVSVVAVLAKGAMVFVQILLLIRKSSLYFFSAASVGEGLFLLIGLGCIFNKKCRTFLSYSTDYAYELIKKSIHFMISSLAVVIYMQIDRIMIGKMMGEYDVGIYSVAVVWASAWVFVPTAVINSLQPLIFQEKSHSNDGIKYHKAIKRMFLSVTLLSAFIACVLSWIGKYLIMILYGNAYKGAIIPFRILVWSGVISMIGVARSTWIVAEEFNKYDKWFAIFSAVINCILDWFAIRKWGIEGAAFATLISYIIAVFVMPFLFSDTRGFCGIFIKSFSEIIPLSSEIKDLVYRRIKRV